MMRLMKTHEKYCIIIQQNTYMCATSCAMIKALVKPSSRFKAHDLEGSHTPDTGAYPEGPPISNRVSHTATS